MTTFISKFITAHPIVVATNSIDAGIYWLDTKPKGYARGDVVSFSFNPRQEWMKGRYTSASHTKIMYGMPGDTIVTDGEGEFMLCPVAAPGELMKTSCEKIGKPLAIDSKGLPLKPWLSENQSYTLKNGEFWFYAPNPKSFDSRYNGPVFIQELKGKAKPLYIWKKFDA